MFDDDASEDEEEQNRFGGGKSMSRGARLLREFKEVPMTPALEYLMKTRRQKITEEVEDAFGSMGAETKASTNAPGGLRSGVNAAALVDQDALDQKLGNAREKSKCLLLPSQIETMKLEYENMDKYQDGILKRAEFIKHLRMDMKVVDFIDADAVKVASSKGNVMTLDQIFYEIERDETYEMMQMSKKEDAINHKEFITWSEFLSYFTDYKEIEERNKKNIRFQ